MPALEDQVEALRRFNRLFTRRIGVLKPRYLGTDFTLTEGRAIYEIGRMGTVTPSELADRLDLDPASISRVLNQLQARRILDRTANPTDKRQRVLSLTDSGLAALKTLDSRSAEQIGQLLGALPDREREDLVGHLHEIGRIFGDHQKAPMILRDHQPGDMGWVVERQTVYYGHEFGWAKGFEAMLAKIVHDFLVAADPKEKCWIAEQGGCRVGCVFVVREDDRTARLRLLYIDKGARGSGLGTTLVNECIRFARRSGYKRLVLWTHSVLEPARRIYERAGFHILETHSHDDFGPEIVSETWELTL